jgi:membrane protein YqaA with SNARE-associated domain
MFNAFRQIATPGHSFTWTLTHLGAVGLFFLTILDSSPIPTFGGADLVVAILASRRQLPWYAYAAIATVGSTIGAYLTFRLARKAGEAYLDNKFGQAKVSRFLKIFKRWGTGALVASTAIPFPFPTSLFFAAAGASDYRLDKFLSVVFIARAARYAAVALVADRYGRALIRVLRHPTQYSGWLLLSVAVFLLLVGGGILYNKRVAAPSAS